MSKAAVESGKFVGAVSAAMAVVTPLGLAAQHWMTYELIGVEGGVREWSLVGAVLISLGLLTGLLVGVPCFWVAKGIAKAGARRAAVFCGLGAAATTVLHRFLAPFATTAVDHAVIPALALVFFGVLYVGYFRGLRPEQPRPSGGA
jgi:hypothetical protein